jgi:hypothetical protein
MDNIILHDVNKMADIILDLKDILYKYEPDEFNISSVDQDLNFTELQKLDIVWVYNKKYVMEVFQTKFNISNNYDWVIDLFTGMIKDTLKNMHKDYVQLVRLFIVAAHNKNDGQLLYNKFINFLNNMEKLDPKYLEYFEIQYKDIYIADDLHAAKTNKIAKGLPTSLPTHLFKDPVTPIVPIAASAAGGGKSDKKPKKKVNK